MNKEITNIDLVEGGNVVKQGDYFTIGYRPRNAKGEAVDLTGKAIAVEIFSKDGIAYESAGEFDSGDGLIYVHVNKNIGYGNMFIEFTVTDPNDATYRLKFPTNNNAGRLTIHRSTDDLEYVGVKMVTVEQLKADQRTFEQSVDGKVEALEQRVETGIGAFTSSTEILDARGGEVNLRARLDKTTAQLAETLKKNDTGVLSLNAFDEPTRNVLQGQTPGTINAVLGSRNVKSINIDDNAVTAKQASFIKKSTNLFNSKDITADSSVSSSTGLPSASVGNSLSGFIPIYPNTAYTSFLVGRKAFYDANKVFILSNTIDGTYTTPNNAFFVRNVVGTVNLNTAQLNLGNTKLPYEPFYEEMKMDVIPLLTGEKIADGSVNIKKIDFMKVGTNNLFNKGKAISDKQLASDGSLVNDPAFSVSEKIAVPPSTAFTAKDIGRYNFIREDGTVHASYTMTGEKTFTTGTSTRFIQFAVRNSDIDTAQINQGSTLLKYEPYTVEIQGVKMTNPKTDQGTGFKYIIDGELDGVFDAPAMESKAEGTSDYLMTKTAAQMYAHYDALAAAYPTYITRTLLGNESTGLPIYRYDFKPKQPGDFVLDMPKVMITTGTHGSEKASTWTAYQTLKQICERWATDPMLDYMRWNIHFIIIPIVNPYGYNAYTRQNSNGVDLNRNFPEYWEASTVGETTYGGAMPLSELESQYVNGVLKAEKNIVYFCDFHNFTTPPLNNYFVWNPASADYNAKISSVLISKLTRKWKKEQPYLPQDDTFFGYSTIFRSATIAQTAYRRYGIESSTFEICERFMLEQPAPKSFSALTFEMGVDAFVNWLALVIKNNLPVLNTK